MTRLSCCKYFAFAGESNDTHARGIALESVGSHSKTRALRTPKYCVSCLALQKRPVPLVPWLASAQTRRDNTMRLYSSPPAHVPSLLTLCKKSVAPHACRGSGRPRTANDRKTSRCAWSCAARPSRPGPATACCRTSCCEGGARHAFKERDVRIAGSTDGLVEGRV